MRKLFQNRATSSADELDLVSGKDRIEITGDQPEMIYVAVEPSASLAAPAPGAPAVALYSLTMDFSEKSARLLEYDFRDLQGMIFGIRTPTADKLKIMSTVERMALTKSGLEPVGDGGVPRLVYILAHERGGPQTLFPNRFVLLRAASGALDEL